MWHFSQWYLMTYELQFPKTVLTLYSKLQGYFENEEEKSLAFSHNQL